MLKFYHFKVYNRHKTFEDSLPFSNTQMFFKYLKINNLKIISYKATHKKFILRKKELLIFTEYLLSLLKSGIEITLALEIIALQEKKAFSHIITTIKKSIINGEGVYHSFNQYRELFGDTYLNLLNAGEKTGNIINNLEKAFENLNLITSLNEKIKHALFYPVIVGSFILILLIFIFLSVLPNFEDFFRGSEENLPCITKFLLGISNNFSLIFIFFIIIIFMSTLIFKTLSQEKKEHIKLNFPILGKFIKKNIIIDFSQNLYIMLESDIDILDALHSIEANCKYIFFKNKLREIHLQIQHGHCIFDAFDSVNFFSDQQLKLINIGERADALPQTFATITTAMQKEMENQLFKLTTLLQPLLLSILGIIIGAVILAVYLPIFNISSMIL